MPRQNGFENKKVVIVGGSSGIGLAVAEEAASQGAEVVIVSSNAARVQGAVKSVGGKAQGRAVDVSDEKAMKAFSRTLVPLITWFSPQVTACNWRRLLRRISSRRDTHLNSAIGLHLPRSNMEVRRFETAARSFSRRESPAGAHRVDG